MFQKRYIAACLWSIVGIWRMVASVDSNRSATAALSPYMIIIDGGSTGSRLHIFEFLGNQECVRRGSQRAHRPLTDFVGQAPAQVARHLLEAFDYAATVIPTAYHNSTRVYYQGTAGMRLLSHEQRAQTYQALYEGLLEEPSFAFRGARLQDFATLSGDMEGYYGAIAANYMKGTIESTLHRRAEHDVVGALDMGGASTQIVYYKHHPTSNSDGEVEGEMVYCDSETHACHSTTVPSLSVLDTKDHQNNSLQLHNDHFFAASYLSYGVDQFRERLWRFWIEEHKTTVAQTSYPEPTCDTKVIASPCNFEGYTFDFEGYNFVGAGDAEACVKDIHRLIPHPKETHGANLGKHVGGVEHPPIRGKFFAMSLFLFSLDSLRELSGHQDLHVNWPNPSIQELYDALDGLCGRSWHDDLHNIQHDAHQYTRAEVLPHRCFEAVYLVTLLKDGFGFAPESRDITFAYLVDDNEVEWSLGMALVMRTKEQQAVLEGSKAPEPAIPHELGKAPAVDEKNRSLAAYLYETLSAQLFEASSSSSASS